MVSAPTMLTEIIPDNIQRGRLSGGRCPYCASLAIQGDSMGVDGDTIMQEYFCHECHKEFDAFFRLDGIVRNR